MRTLLTAMTAVALAACVPSGRPLGTLEPRDSAITAEDDASARPRGDAATPARDASTTGPTDAATPADDATASGADDAAASAPDAAPPRDGGAPSPCPAAPAGAPAEAEAALARANAVRTAMGAGCATMEATLNTAAARHCLYYSSNRATSSCVANPHEEVMGCANFVAARFDARMRAAGYAGAPAFENMHFVGDGRAAVDGWIDSVWHRTPVLSPWVTVFGYGQDGACDTADYGTAAGAPRDTVAVYPYDGQAGVPASFDGRREGPNPPAPPTGWPSGYPIHVYAQSAITEHTLTVDGQATPIDHVWLTPSSPEALGLLRTEYVLYAHAPMAAGTTYRVTVRGASVDRSWTFTTR